MNPELKIVRRRLFAMARQQRDYLVGKPEPYVREILAECEADRSVSLIERAAAEINRRACKMVLKGKLKP